MNSDPLDEPFRIPIEDTIDLHSVSQQDAQAVFEEYLREAAAAGFTAIRVIHGRGVGVRREMVRKVLSRNPLVVSYRDAPAEAGGWGATVVTLRIPDVPGKISES